MTERYTNLDIKLSLSDLRSKIRNGQVTVYFRADPTAVRRAVAKAMSLKDADSFNTENFNPQTLLRFAHLFAVPTVDHGDHKHYPSQDDLATALQNFINRRKDVWAHFFAQVRNSVEATHPQASA